jgi:hypothetical protein
MAGAAERARYPLRVSGRPLQRGDG